MTVYKQKCLFENNLYINVGTKADRLLADTT